MKLINLKNEIVPIIIIVIMFVIAAVVYEQLPRELPIHWNIKGNVDGYVMKSPIASLLFPLLALGTWILFLLLPHVDPNKEKYPFFQPEYFVIKCSTLLFFLYIYLVMLGQMLGMPIPVVKAMSFGIGMLLIAIGNPMGKIRFNYFVGIRLPWTLANEEVWNKTHRLGGKLFVVSGILMILCATAIPAVSFVVGIASVIVGIGACAAYSFVLYQRINPSKNCRNVGNQ